MSVVPQATGGERGRGLYARALRLRHLHLEPWMRPLLLDLPLGLGVLLALADLASAWVVLVAPLSVALAVLFHERVAALLARERAGAQPARVRPRTREGWARRR